MEYRVDPLQLPAQLAQAAVLVQQAAKSLDEDARAWVAESLPALATRLTSAQPFACTVSAWQNEQLIGLAHSLGSQVTDVYVDPNHQRQGIGQQLLQHLQAQQQNVVWWHVLAQPSAVAFYECAGFVSHGQAKLADFNHQAIRLTKWIGIASGS